MVALGAPAGPWGQLASLAFVCAGLVGDLLLVRLFLTLAYLCLFVQAAAGFPTWPEVLRLPHHLPLDAVVWALLGFYIHASATVRLLLDERSVALDDREEELWRMFYRRSGLSRFVFKSEILKFGRFDTFEPGEVITEPSKASRVFILVQGRVDATVEMRMGRRDLKLFSGDIFEFKFINLFGVDIGFKDSSMVATARSEVRAFSISARDMETMSHGSAVMRQAWHTVIIAAVARAAERANGHLSPAQVVAEQADDWRDPVFRDLLRSERPAPEEPGSGVFFKRPLTNLVRLFRNSLSLPFPFQPPPSALRHRAGRSRERPEPAEEVVSMPQSKGAVEEAGGKASGGGGKATAACDAVTVT